MTKHTGSSQGAAKSDLSSTGAHTSGPWHIDGFNMAAVIVLISENENGRQWDTIARCEGSNWQANARLIASAPDLLAALESIAQRCNESGTGELGERETIYAVHELARSALSRAKGEK